MNDPSAPLSTAGTEATDSPPVSAGARPWQKVVGALGVAVVVWVGGELYNAVFFQGLPDQPALDGPVAPGEPSGGGPHVPGPPPGGHR